MSPDELSNQLEESESKEYGELGDDDIFITPKESDVEYQFCHHIGIHITGPLGSQILKLEKERYESKGWDVTELGIINKK